MVALLIVGSAILLCSCKSTTTTEIIDSETLITQQSDSLTIISSENGIKNYRFSTQLMESYELAKEPYKEFRKGVHIETFKDSTGVVESSLVADYAIFWDKLKLWEAKGNVKAVNARGEILETQQLFWNQRTKKIYSNVDTKVTQGTDVIIGIGFESNEQFDDFTFRRPRGKVSVDTEPNTNPDASATDPNAVRPPLAPSQTAAPAAANPGVGIKTTPMPAGMPMHPTMTNRQRAREKMDTPIDEPSSKR